MRRSWSRLCKAEKKKQKLQLSPPEGLRWGMTTAEWKERFGEPLRERVVEEPTRLEELCCEAEMLVKIPCMLGCHLHDGKMVTAMQVWSFGDPGAGTRAEALWSRSRAEILWDLLLRALKKKHGEPTAGGRWRYLGREVVWMGETTVIVLHQIEPAKTIAEEKLGPEVCLMYMARGYGEFIYAEGRGRRVLRQEEKAEEEQ